MKIVLHKHDVDLIVVGSSFTEFEGSEESYLKRLSKRLGISDNVVFTGRVHIDELKKLYASADIFCLPTLHEVLPMVILEAMASKICVLSTMVAGIPEVIDNGKDGLLVAPRDTDSLAKRLLNLLENDQLREELSENAYKKIIENYSWSNIAKKTLKVYEKLIFASLPL
jgi:glycosyltransferase involved in cell wall biosynthesis